MYPLSARSSSSQRRLRSASICRVIALRRGGLSIETMRRTGPPARGTGSCPMPPLRYTRPWGRKGPRKAGLCRAWGTPDVLRFEAVETGAVRPNEVRIRVRAAGANFADTLMVGGTYQVKPPFPFIPGLEAAGVIVEVGADVAGLQAGHRVLAVLRPGGAH